MEWNKFINDLRKTLGLTIEQFGRLMGVTQETVNGWLYRSVIPAPLHRDLLMQIYSNKDVVGKEIEKQKQQQYQVEMSNSGNPWPFILAGIGTVSFAYGMYKVLDLVFKKNKGKTP